MGSSSQLSRAHQAIDTQEEKKTKEGKTRKKKHLTGIRQCMCIQCLSARCALMVMLAVDAHYSEGRVQRLIELTSE